MPDAARKWLEDFDKSAQAQRTRYTGTTHIAAEHLRRLLEKNERLTSALEAIDYVSDRTDMKCPWCWAKAVQDQDGNIFFTKHKDGCLKKEALDAG